jgi:hypothetical protein
MVARLVQYHEIGRSSRLEIMYPEFTVMVLILTINMMHMYGSANWENGAS